MFNRDNLSKYTKKQATLVSIKISLFIGISTAVLTLSIFIFQSITSMESSAKNLQSNLAYWLQVGDQFQIERTILNLNEHTRDNLFEVETLDAIKWGASPKLTFVNGIYKTNDDLYFSYTEKLIASDNSLIGKLIIYKRLPLNSSGYLFLGLMIVSMIASLLIKKLFTSFGAKLIAPVIRLSKEIDQANDTDSLKKIKPEVDDLYEIASLSNTVSTMANKIALQHELELKHELLSAKEDLALKVAHDIRSPLDALSIILQKDSFDSNYKNIALNSIERISSIANNLLSEGKSHLSSPNLVIKEENISTIINSVLEEKRVLCTNKSISFSFVCTERQPVTKIDPIEFGRIISNLINNSIEAFNTSGHITVNVSKFENELVIKVSDNGRGIPAETLPLLMSKGSSFGKINGNGLGLFYAKKVLNAFNGSIAIDSTEGIGTTVTITLPHLYHTKTDVDYVLVEDDEFIRKLWCIEAQNSDIRFTSFESSKQLLDNLNELSRSTSFYIDSDLGNDDLGEELARKLYQLGYNNLFMASGYGPDHFNHLPFLKGVTGKEIPWTMNS